MNWVKLNNNYLQDIIEFAQKHYPKFDKMPVDLIQTIFETYKNSTCVFRNNRGFIRGFAVYQEWPDVLNFIMICLPFGSKHKNLKNILSGRSLLPNKKIVWFDEERMEGRGLCHH